jgi:hypothetical protein
VARRDEFGANDRPVAAELSTAVARQPYERLRAQWNGKTNGAVGFQQRAFSLRLSVKRREACFFHDARDVLQLSKKALQDGFPREIERVPRTGGRVAFDGQTCNPNAVW